MSPTATGLDAVLAAVGSAAATLLAVGEPLTPAPATRNPDVLAAGTTSVLAAFTGAAPGDVLITIDEQVATALRGSSLGELDLAAALRPTVEEIAAAIGPVALGPLQVVDTRLGLNRVLAHPDAALVPLEGTAGVRACVAVALTSGAGAPSAGSVAGGGGAAGWAAAVRAAGGRAAATGGPGGVAPGLDTLQAQRLDLLRGVEMEATAELGRARMTINDLLSLRSGAVIELDRAAGAPADLFVNGRLIAHAEVVVVDENYGLRITQIVSDAAR